MLPEINDFCWSGKFKKAKQGDLFMESVGTSIETSETPRLLVFQGRLLRKAQRWTNDPKLYDLPFVHFKVALTGEDVFAEADDRYGRYPRLDNSQEGKLRARLAEIKAQAATYEHILGELDAYRK
ncbi:hypothetical protein AAY80_248 [Stenotrophomonas phage vB_SmaS-DLP_6]|nr:hypothetical protein AAY80_248 [Stenotrophomonas phage vB_SmaS-DLP_6]